MIFIFYSEINVKLGKMSNLLIVNIVSWSPEQVSHWLRGLDDSIQPYVDRFVQHDINGKKLLLLDHQDLDKLGVKTLGHQELILEAVDLLLQLQYSMENETIQMLALKLSCQTRSISNEALRHENIRKTLTNEKLPREILSGVVRAVGYIKTLVSWLDRAPFDSSDEYIKKRNDFVKYGNGLIDDVQGDNVFDSMEELKSHSNDITTLCEDLILNSKDSLTIQPAWLEIAVIRKKPDEELGLHIQSSYNGNHTIGGIKEESPAFLCRKVDEGDEVIMVNNKMVIGWQLRKLVDTLKENKKEINLTLKKRPCHADPFGHKGHRKKRSNKLQPGTFPMKGMRSKKSRKSGKRMPLQLINTTPDNVTENFTESVKEVESENDALDDNDNVFRSGSESPGFQNLRTFDDKVKQRRATVSGGSPTLKRPSIMISDSDTAPRPKSYALTLSSPGSEEYGSLELSSFDLGSSASERTSPPVADESTSGSSSKVTSPPLSATLPSQLLQQPPVINISTEDSPQSDQADKTLSGNDSKEGEPSKNSDVQNQQQKQEENVTNKNTELSKSSDQTSATCDSATSEIVNTEDAQGNENNSAKENKEIKTGVQSKDTVTVLKDKSSLEKEVTNRSASPVSGSKQSKESSSTQRIIGTYPRSNAQLSSSANNSPKSKVKKWESPNSSPSSTRSQSPNISMGKKTLDSESPRRKRKNEQQAAKTIAGAIEEINSPTTLLSIKRIDSVQRAELGKAEKLRANSSTCEETDRPQSVAASYSVTVVGGLPHVVKSPPIMTQDHPVAMNSPKSILRDKGDKKGGRSIMQRLVGANRRISCKDLGHGDCQGWLYKKKESHSLGSNFLKRWCVLKENNLYFYKSPDDLRAKGVIHLPGFQCSPAVEVKTRKYAFKVHHSGATFYFASDRQEDRAKWMNKMGLASIAFTAHTNLSTVSESKQDGYYSESDDDDDTGKVDISSASLQSSREDLAAAQSNDDLVNLSKTIIKNNITLDSKDVNEKRRKRLTSNNELLNIENVEELEKMKKLSSLERTLKVKENELLAIEALLEHTILDSNTLEKFKEEHPDILTSLREEEADVHNHSPTSEEEV